MPEANQGAGASGSHARWKLGEPSQEVKICTVWFILLAYAINLAGWFARVKLFPKRIMGVPRVPPMAALFPPAWLTGDFRRKTMQIGWRLNEPDLLSDLCVRRTVSQASGPKFEGRDRDRALPESSRESRGPFRARDHRASQLCWSDKQFAAAPN